MQNIIDVETFEGYNVIEKFEKRLLIISSGSLV